MAKKKTIKKKVVKKPIKNKEVLEIKDDIVIEDVIIEEKIEPVEEKEEVIEEKEVVNVDNKDEEKFYQELGKIVGRWNGNVWNIKPFTTELLKPFYTELGYTLDCDNCGFSLTAMYKILYIKYHKYID